MLDRVTQFLDWVGTWYNEKVAWVVCIGTLTATLLFYGVVVK